MPTPILMMFMFLLAVAVAAGVALVFTVGREFWAEATEPASGWDDTPTGELAMWVTQDRKEKLRCPSCQGTQCWDWRRNNQKCGDNPTVAEPNPDYLTGRHYHSSVQPAASGWWPNPRSHAARVRPYLWRKVADHCQIALVRPVAVALP